MAPRPEDLIRQYTAERATAEREAQDAKNALTRFFDRLEAEGGSEARMTPEQESRGDELAARHRAAVARVAHAKAAIDVAREVAGEEHDYAARSREHFPGAAPPPARETTRAHIGREQRTYSRDNNDRGCTGHQFLLDVTRSMLGIDPGATERLAAHMREEMVERQVAPYQPMEQRLAGDTNTGNWAGLTVPQYLVDFYAPAVAAHRPFADICNPHPLPAPGMSINISRVTTATAVSLQATELSTGGEQSADDTLLTLPVQTALGDQTISRQAIDRGTGIEDVIMQDLFARYATTLDATLITQAVTGLSASATSNAFVNASPTAPLLYPFLLQAQSGSEVATLGIPVTHAIMHSRRWNWMSAHLGATYPLINTAGIPPFSAGTNDPNASYNSGIRGRLPNSLAVVCDNNIATNLGAGTEDEIYIVPQRECHLWEDANAPLFIRAEQTKAAQLGVLVVVYGYFAYTFGRYLNAMQKVSGTGLIAPNFVTA